MGLVVSAGADNDELTTNLCEANYIISPAVEHAFRNVDRGHYFPGDSIEDAYRDLAWKRGNIHISAPCIYSEVVEALEVQEGMSFLNIGSGTGYLSTLVGLLLGPYGCNHGVEVHGDVVSYAYERLIAFTEHNPSRVLAAFCKPTFVHGNCLLLNPVYRQYDRIYCGADCPLSQEEFVKSLLKVGGILVMPVEDNLVKYKRIKGDEFEKVVLVPVHFAPLIDLPVSFIPHRAIEIASQPLTLKEVCRIKLMREFSEEWIEKRPHLALPAGLVNYLTFKTDSHQGHSSVADGAVQSTLPFNCWHEYSRNETV